MDGTPATCKDAGLTDGIKCSVCNTVLTPQQATQALHHTWGNPVVTKAPSCTEKGVATQTCSVCGETSTLDIPPQHSWAKSEVTTKATCVQTGIRTETCSVCGETRNTVIALADHELKFVEETDTVAAHYHCDVCGQDFSDATGGNVVVDTSRIPVQDGFVTLWWTSSVQLNDWESIWFTGSVNDWGLTSETALEAQNVEGTNVYYVFVAQSKMSASGTYKLALGYNETSGLDEQYLGVNWDYTATTTSSDQSYSWDKNGDDAQRVALGTHSFSKHTTDPANLVLVQFYVEFSATSEIPEGYTVYLVGSMGKNGGWQNDPIVLSQVDDTLKYESDELLLAKQSYTFKVVVVKGEFSYSGGAELNATDATVKVSEAGEVALYTAKKDFAVFTAHFWNLNSWPRVNFHYWNAPGGSEWPGIRITTADEDGWYTYELPTGGKVWTGQTSGLGIIFDSKLNNSGDQTGDIHPAAQEVWIVGQAGKMYTDKASAESYIKTATPVPNTAWFLSGKIAGNEAWVETTQDWDRVLTADGSNFSITVSLKANDEFKIKKNVSDGWSSEKNWSLANGNITGADGVDVTGLFKETGGYGGNIGATKACTVKITLDVSANKILIYVISLD